MTSFQVIRTHTSPYQAKDFLETERKVISHIPGLDYKLLGEADLKTPVILITNTHTQLSKLAPELLAKTKLIIHPNSGYDHFASEKDIIEKIPLIVGHEVRAQAVAEYSLSCLFEGLSELPQHLSWHAQRDWERPLLKGLPVWIFGHGHIGSIVARTLAALGMKVTVVDPYQSSPYKTLRRWQDGNFSEARVVISCCSLNKTSQHLFNEEFFAAAHPHLLFINGARGKLVDEKALRVFLQTRSKAMAFLDVFEQEPFTEDWHHFPQVWKTSHIAGVYKGLDQKIIDFETKVLNDFLKLETDDFNSLYEKELLQNKWKQGVLV